MWERARRCAATRGPHAHRCTAAQTCSLGRRGSGLRPDAWRSARRSVNGSIETAAQVYRPPLVADPFYAQSNYPLEAIYPADDSHGTDASDVDRVSTRAFGFQADVLDPCHTANCWNGIPLIVGARGAA